MSRPVATREADTYSSRQAVVEAENDQDTQIGELNIENFEATFFMAKELLEQLGTPLSDLTPLRNQE